MGPATAHHKCNTLLIHFFKSLWECIVFWSRRCALKTGLSRAGTGAASFAVDISFRKVNFHSKHKGKTALIMPDFDCFLVQCRKLLTSTHPFSNFKSTLTLDSCSINAVWLLFVKWSHLHWKYISSLSNVAEPFQDWIYSQDSSKFWSRSWISSVDFKLQSTRRTNVEHLKKVCRESTNAGQK